MLLLQGPRLVKAVNAILCAASLASVDPTAAALLADLSADGELWHRVAAVLVQRLGVLIAPPGNDTPAPDPAVVEALFGEGARVGEGDAGLLQVSRK